ncbi:MAG: hypothetical protein ACR2GO_05660 [Candidatus Limnocylindria bacterium]
MIRIHFERGVEQALDGRDVITGLSAYGQHEPRRGGVGPFCDTFRYRSPMAGELADLLDPWQRAPLDLVRMTGPLEHLAWVA